MPLNPGKTLYHSPITARQPRKENDVHGSLQRRKDRRMVCEMLLHRLHRHKETENEARIQPPEGRERI